MGVYCALSRNPCVSGHQSPSLGPLYGNSFCHASSASIPLAHHLLTVGRSFVSISKHSSSSASQCPAAIRSWFFSISRAAACSRSVLGMVESRSSSISCSCGVARFAPCNVGTHTAHVSWWSQSQFIALRSRQLLPRHKSPKSTAPNLPCGVWPRVIGSSQGPCASSLFPVPLLAVRRIPTALRWSSSCLLVKNR